MSDNNIVDFKVELDSYTGKLTINLLQYLNELDEAQIHDLLSDNGIWAVVSERAIVESLKNSYAGPNYNAEIHRIRQALLQDPSIVGEILAAWVKGVVQAFSYEIQNAHRYEKAYWNIYHSKIIEQLIERGCIERRDWFALCKVDAPDSHVYNMDKEFEQTIRAAFPEKLK